MWLALKAILITIGIFLLFWCWPFALVAIIVYGCLTSEKEEK